MYTIRGSWLVFDEDFDRPLTDIVFPKHIHKVKFGEKFKQSVSCLPKHITHLALYFSYLNLSTTFPPTITHLDFYNTYFLDPMIVNVINIINIGEFLKKMGFFGWIDKVLPKLNSYYLCYLMIICEKQFDGDNQRCSINKHNLSKRQTRLFDMLL